MSYNFHDLELNGPESYDDRNLEIDPDFELNEKLSHTTGFGGRDPADY